MRRPALPWRPVLVVAARVLAQRLLIADPYGFDRDEHYFLEVGG